MLPIGMGWLLSDKKNLRPWTPTLRHLHWPIHEIPEGVTIMGISYICAHVPMSPWARTSVPDDWLTAVVLWFSESPVSFVRHLV